MSPSSLCAIPHLLSSGSPRAKQIDAVYQLLLQTAKQSETERRAQQLAQLFGVVLLAQHLVPGYRARLPKWSRDHNMSWQEFHDLPILKRSDLQELGTDLHSVKPHAAYQSVASATSSGSTGKPIVTHGHRASGIMGKALQLRMQAQQDYDFGASCAFIVSPHKRGVADPPHGKVAGSWSAPLGQGEAKVLSLLTDTVDQLQWLRKMSAPYFATYPSNLLALLKESERTGIQPLHLRSVVLSSEPVSNELIAMTERLWGAECLPTYSASEVGLMACAAVDGSGYYVQSENVYLEVLREDDSPCRTGEVGRVVVTTLQDFLRPLIRYEVGDYAELAETDENDPVTLPRMRRIVGRERTMIRLPQGGQIWPHFEFAALIEHGGIRQWQLVQRKDMSIDVRVVPTGEMTRELAEMVHGVVTASLPGIEARVQSVSKIERTAGGKYLELVSEL